MPLNDRRLTGRDVLAKTFQAKTKRGYDPIEVDAYLELVAAQIDVLHSDLTQQDNGVPAAPQTAALSMPTSVDTEETEHRNAELQVEIQTLLAEREELQVQVAQLAADSDSLRSENGQLRSQLTSIAPPPPIAQPAVEEVPEVAEVAEEEVLAVAQSSDDRASEESLELVLRMARRSAEETISEAHNRADEIVAEANLTASQITKESDRKAYEAANKVQAELASLSAEIETQQGTLKHLQSRTTDQRNELRDLAGQILQLADAEPRRYEGAEVVDLRETPSDATA